MIRRSPIGRMTAASVAASVCILAIAGCGRLNRSATLNQTRGTPGAATATTLQQYLAKQGFPAAKVTCAKTMIINVGTTTSCTLTGAGTHSTVRFTFKDTHGAINSPSVTPY